MSTDIHSDCEVDPRVESPSMATRKVKSANIHDHKNKILCAKDKSRDGIIIAGKSSRALFSFFHRNILSDETIKVGTVNRVSAPNWEELSSCCLLKSISRMTESLFMNAALDCC
jgi:hypothetical protein